MGTTDRIRGGVLLTTFGLYLATLVAFAFPWLRQMRDVIPSYPFRQDEEFIVWALAWVAHALVDVDARVFDANIFHPAPDQLTGSEYLFSFQPLFAPLYFVTGQPLLATGIVTFVTYPLAAFAMAVLLMRLGCSRLVAWLVGLTFALGILRVPLNFHTLQYPNVLLPLVGLGALRARSAPTVKSGLWVFLSLLAALLTSFYLAAIVCIALAFWTLGELIVSRRGISGFMTVVALALLAAIFAAALVLHPYATRSEGIVPYLLPWDHTGSLRGWTWAAFAYWRINTDMWRVPFALLALLGIGGRGDATWRRTSVLGAVLCTLSVGLVTVGLPPGLSELAALTPLRNLRGWVRLLVITDFGLCLLAAAGLDLCRRRFGMWVAGVPIAAFALLTALPRLTNLASGMTAYPPAWGARAEAYRTVERHADAIGRGPLLELPSGATDREAMFGSSYHWLPLVSGLSGHSPPHARATRAAIDALPDPAALQDLIDLTHLRWILLRPDQDWGSPRLADRMRQALRGLPLIGRSWSFYDFTLYEVTGVPVRTGWYPAIAAGPVPGRTVLGTAVRRLSSAEAVASIDSLRRIPSSVNQGTVTLNLKVQNSGTADWPVLTSSATGSDVLAALTIYLEARWTRLPESPTAETTPDVVHPLLLDRDLLAGETLVQFAALPTPLVAGRYALGIRVVQKDGPALGEPPSRMLRRVLDVQPRGPAAADVPAMSADRDFW